MADTSSSSTVTLRVALVCYGGVSLAIYMHGVTKELLKLVQASQAFEQPPAEGEAEPRNPFGKSDSAAAYFEALRDIAAAGLHLRVVIDVITGTSAGGINGVCLARALVRGESLDSLTSLWLEQGDIKKLLSRPPHVPWPARLKDAATVMGAMNHVLKSDRHTGAPLDGDHFAQLVYGALKDMKPTQGGTTGTLVPADQRLTLVVPTTDVHGFSAPIPDGAGNLAHTDSSHRQALRFDYAQGGEDEFTDDDVPALAFAARATAGFPGAFPSLSVESFAKAVGVPDGDVERITQRFVYDDRLGVDALNAWYIDGGVLDNGPFDHAVAAIADMPATGETRRVLAYLEPDPGPGPRAIPRKEPQPSWYDVVKAGMWTIPRHSTYTEALRQVSQMNQEVDDVAGLVGSLEHTVDTLLADLHLGIGSTYDEVVAAANQLRKDARASSPITFQTYCQLRAESVAAEFGVLLSDALGYHPSSVRAGLVPQVLSAWVRSREEWTAEDPTDLESLLGPVDLPLRRRRVMLLLQTINTLLRATPKDDPVRTGLTTLKGVCWQLLVDTRVAAEKAVADLRTDAEKVLGAGALGPGYVTLDPATFAGAHSAQLEELYERFKQSAGLAGSSKQLWETFTSATTTWPAETRQLLASRYLGFPLWDLAVFPVVELSDLPQLSKIDVCRFSPLDAKTLPTPPDRAGEPTPKLRGTKFHHFGGFFERDWRENDYLWGRLDGVVLIMDLLASQTVPPGKPALEQHVVDGLDAVLADEAPKLTSIPELIGQLGIQTARLGPQAT